MPTNSGYCCEYSMAVDMGHSIDTSIGTESQSSEDVRSESLLCETRSSLTAASKKMVFE